MVEMDTMKNSVVVDDEHPRPLGDKTGRFPSCFSETGLKTAVLPVVERRRKMSKDEER
jgi:hypothetical protein